MKTSFNSATRLGYLSLFIVFVSFLALLVMAESTGETKTATNEGKQATNGGKSATTTNEAKPTLNGRKSAPNEAKSATKGGPKVYIVLTQKPKGNEDPKAFHLRTLTTALGSAQAAKSAMVYSYTNAATGFSARLTPEQVAKISKLPGVNKVMQSESYQLQNGVKQNGMKGNDMKLN